MDLTFTIVFALLSLSALGAKAAIDEKLLMENMEECKKKNKLEDKDLEAVMKANYTAEKSKCFVTCVGEKIGYIQDNEFSERGALTAVDRMLSGASSVEKLKAKEVVTACAKNLTVNAPKGCAIGPATAYCLAKGAIENGIITPDHIAKVQSN